MKVLGRPALWLALASITLVLVFVYWDRERVSPGPLSAVHEREPALAGGGCALCHGSGTDGFESACTSCHAEIGRQIAEQSGLHGATPQARACERCHSEHHGTEFALAGSHAFALAGVPDRERFAHEHVDFRLDGRHATLRCADCHANADVAVLAQGERRFVGLDQSCVHCHEDPHAGELPDCAACHGQEKPFAEVASFAHTDAFPLDGSHAGVACARCHEPGGDSSIAASAAKSAPRTCEACHASPHTQDFERSDPRGCVACHLTSHDSFRHEGALFTRAQHAITGFPLDPPHDRAACSDCHARAGDRVAFPGRRADDCRACHADPHGGQFDGRDVAALGCLSCHEPHRFTPPRFDVVAHAATAFPLTHSHAAIACGECHLKATVDAARIFHGTSSACSSCHSDAHAGKFGTASCSECHTTIAFDAPRATPFDHALRTGFALAGAHARASCESCHRSAAQPDEHGRRFGRALVDAARATCASCHSDAHAGKFAGTDCDACHTQERFDELAVPFDHALRAGFALDGAHARSACSACHPRAHAPDATGRRFGRSTVPADAARADCRACHPDPHAGAFDRPGLPRTEGDRSGCLRCHTTESFGGVRAFDHALWTGFRLDGVHASVACASCHAPVPSQDGRSQRFGKAAGTDCGACHSDPHVGQFARNGATDCARCHTSSQSFTTLAFDHQHDTRFPLDATHARLDCSACHVSSPLPGGGRAVRYKPLGTSCSDCHDPRDARNPR
ncbi:MAG: cytochrome c3 family protein [Planctomycetota bacterium]